MIAAEQKATEFKVTQLNVNITVPLPVIKPWLHSDASDFTLLEKKNKDKECNSHNVQKYINEHHSYVQIYTDASKSLENLGIAITFISREKIGLSVYTGEMN